MPKIGTHKYVWLLNLKVEALTRLGHAILGNFSTDQMVIEFTKISKQWLKTIEEL